MLVLLAACGGLECGPGTVEKDGACVAVQASDVDTDTDTDADTDTDSDADTDADTDSDTDSDTDADHTAVGTDCDDPYAWIVATEWEDVVNSTALVWPAGQTFGVATLEAFAAADVCSASCVDPWALPRVSAPDGSCDDDAALPVTAEAGEVVDLCVVVLEPAVRPAETTCTFVVDGGVHEVLVRRTE